MKSTFFTTIGLLAIATLLFSCGKTQPARQFIFFNSSDKELNLVIERDGKNEVDKQVAPHSNVFEYLKTGKIKIACFDGDKCVQVFKDYAVSYDSTNKAYTCVDMLGTTRYAIVATSYLYGASNSLAQSIADTKIGGDKMSLLGPILNSDKPFDLSFDPIWPYDKLPKEIGALGAGWALVPIYMPSENQEEINAYIDSYLRNLGTK